MINLVNKTVKVNDIDDFMFYFPGFTVRKVLDITDYGSKVLYTGVMNKKAQQILDSCDYIATQGLYQYDFTQRSKKIEFVFSKWNREVTKQIVDTIDSYDDEEFNFCCKTYWVSGRWPYRIENDMTLYDLYRSSVSSVGEFVQTYYKACKDFPEAVVEQAFLTFIQRSKSIDEQNISPQYKRLLKQFVNTSGQRVKGAVQAYLESDIENRQLRFLEFIYNLRG